jgi:hypothetical protein
MNLSVSVSTVSLALCLPFFFLQFVRYFKHFWPLKMYRSTSTCTIISIIAISLHFPVCLKAVKEIFFELELYFPSECVLPHFPKKCNEWYVFT